MQYVHILALIDADLERLKKVRLLLTTLDTPPKGTQKRARNPPVPSKTLRTAEGQKPAAPALQIDEHEVSQRENARPAMRLKKPAVSKLSVTPLATPLGGLVPTGPIFIPAELIRQKQSQSRQESVMERGASGPAAIVPLTAELLTRRWIRSLV